MTGEQVPTQEITHRRMAEELRSLIDLLKDPLASVRQPEEYEAAYRDLLILIGSEDRWNMVFAVQPGCKSNYILTVLTAARVEWLKQFKDMNLT